MAESAVSKRLGSKGVRRRWIGLVCCATALVSLAADERRPDRNIDPDVPAEPPAAKVAGRLIRVPLPITGNVDNRVKSMVQRALGRVDRSVERPVIVFEMATGQSEFGEGSDFTRALNLARFLSSPELADVKTVAYVPRSIKGHAVLVAMACEEIVMHPETELGEAGIDEPAEQSIEPAVRSGYRQIAERRRTIPALVALAMLDKELEVLRVETEVNPSVFVLRENLQALRDEQVVQSQEVLVRRGDLGRFNGREGRELGFVKYLASDRSAVAKALNLPDEALHEDPSLGGDWNPVELILEGEVTARAVGRLQTMLKDQMSAGGVNFLCLRINSQGGSLAHSMELANFLAGLDRSTIRTVAYVPGEARAGAALVAVACDDLVMHSGAVLGGSGDYTIPEDEIEPARQVIRDSLAESKGKSWSLLAALIDPQLEVYAYRNKSSGAVEYFCEEEFNERNEQEDWVQGEDVVGNKAVLEANGEEAVVLGLAGGVVANFSEFKQLYGLQDDPRLVEPGWADYLIEALARPELAILLLAIGGVAVYAELQMPGIGIGGFVATVCFLLFFWSKFLDNTAGWLEVLLFLGGFLCLLLEVFVLPGFGIFGLGGGLLIIASLVLASQTFILPTNKQELIAFRNSLLVVAGAAVGIVFLGTLVRRYLPHAPFFNRIMLNPNEGELQEELSMRGAVVDFRHLVGKRGVTTTQLTPSGKARFGDEFVDVIADGEVIERGTEIVVVHVQGNRILVQTDQQTGPAT